MKYITNLFGVGCVALFAMLFIAPGAFAQTTYYVDPDNGVATGTCNITADPAEAPCLLDHAVSTATTAGDIILIRVRRSGGSVTLPAPSTALANLQRYGAYVRGSGDRVKGSLEFTGNFQLAGGGRFELDSLATVQFEDITTTEARTDATVSLIVVDPAANEKNPASRVTISGKLTTHSATLGALVVADDLTIERPAGATESTLRVDSLTVNSEQP